MWSWRQNLALELVRVLPAPPWRHEKTPREGREHSRIWPEKKRRTLQKKAKQRGKYQRSEQKQKRDFGRSGCGHQHQPTHQQPHTQPTIKLDGAAGLLTHFRQGGHQNAFPLTSQFFVRIVIERTELFQLSTLVLDSTIFSVSSNNVDILLKFLLAFNFSATSFPTSYLCFGSCGDTRWADTSFCGNS